MNKRIWIFFHKRFKVFLIIIFLSLIIFYTASQGNSVLFMFLFADLLCCAAAIPIFYGLYSKKLSSKITFTSILMGLIFGLAFFPDQSFQKSLVVGNLIDVEFFPTWFSTALLFWSFIFALLVPQCRDPCHPTLWRRPTHRRAWVDRRTAGSTRRAPAPACSWGRVPGPGR